MKLSAVLEFLEITTHNWPDSHLNNIVMDSRQVQPGDLFVAVPGENFKGQDFIDQAISNGAAAILVQCQGIYDYRAGTTIGAGTRPAPTIPVFELQNLSSRLNELARFYYQYPDQNLKIIAVTGTNGKTSCSHYTAQLLNALGLNCGVMGTLGNGLLPNLQASNLTTSDCFSIQRQFAEFRNLSVNYVAMELSSHALVQGRMKDTQIDTAIFTNLSQDHLDYHVTMEEYFLAKAKLFIDYQAKHCVINLDDNYAARLISLINNTSQVITYSVSNPLADIYLEQNKLFTPWGTGILDSPLMGNFNISNILACIACCGLQQQSTARILEHVKNIVPVSGRMQRVRSSGAKEPLVIVDYAHTPDALSKALLALRDSCSGNLYCIFGCGGDRDRTKRSLMLTAALEYSDKIVITQDNPRTEDPQQIVADMLNGAELQNNITIELDRAKAIQNTILSATEHDLILIAGKGHEDYQVIGTQKLPFSDLTVAQQALELRSENVWIV